ncbi:FF domain-containing protein [Isoalcanivorax pacificus W11-5]|uniref:FF domain-containing protein n=1 Tax=Isoalcanivorax pacificus W11-5 TaxID=391936 RepID=A0A0B4XLI6_9GAMM|nr:metal-dependent hydrolase [Isoalcanivorax pacificus]AJD47555.1 FF domain-containing protein [Isoalcanivorax pacificus W11-5]
MNMAVLPIRRDLKFNLPADKATDWHEAGMHVAQFFNTLSLFFPVGERFFIDSVRHYRDQVTDPELKKAVTAFIGQEAMHGREHDELNDLLDAAGVPAKAQEKFVLNLLKGVQKYTPKHFQLAATVALEHLTAILADSLLRNPETLGKSDERFVALWNWHALEETEHKAVAFDVYTTVMGKTLYSYALRTSTLVLATSIFMALQYPFYIENVRRKGGLFNLKGWVKTFQYQWGRPGTLRQAVGDWFDWFKPGFHPWDHDNRAFLERLDSVLEVITREEEKAA